MSGASSAAAAVLMVASVAWMGLLALLCVRCKRKSTIIRTEHQIYDPQIFQRGGSVFAVTTSKTVTRSTRITPTTVREYDEEPLAAPTDEQSDYENITDAQMQTDAEHMYVDPLPAFLYVNEQTPERIIVAEQNTDVYANIFTSLSIKEDDDYENSEFLEQGAQEQEVEQQNDDEPDYVNENGEAC